MFAMTFVMVIYPILRANHLTLLLCLTSLLPENLRNTIPGGKMMGLLATSFARALVRCPP